jgi:hypothetical protein
MNQAKANGHQGRVEGFYELLIKYPQGKSTHAAHLDTFISEKN